MLNPRAIAVSGVGYGALVTALLGLWPVSDEGTQPTQTYAAVGGFLDIRRPTAEDVQRERERLGIVEKVVAQLERLPEELKTATAPEPGLEALQQALQRLDIQWLAAYAELYEQARSAWITEAIQQELALLGLLEQEALLEQAQLEDEAAIVLYGFLEMC